MADASLGACSSLLTDVCSLMSSWCERQADRWRERETDGASAPLRQPNELMAVQTGAALAAGCTSATLTNPLDVIKTRLQVQPRILGADTHWLW